MKWSYDSEKSRELLLGLPVHEKAIFRILGPRVRIAYALGLTGAAQRRLVASSGGRVLRGGDSDSDQVI